MKGIQGLFIAIFLGVLGAVLNLVYLNRGKNIETDYYVGVRKGAKLTIGKPILKEHLEPVPIPTARGGDLRQYAFLYDEDLYSIVGQKAVRNYTGQGGELFLREHLRTPPVQLALKEGEAAVSVPINSSMAITSQIIPGETPVYFQLPKSRGSIAVDSAAAAEPWEWVGPFDVLSVGNRLGTTEVMRSQKISEKQRNVLTLRAKFAAGQMEAMVAELKEYLRRTNNTPLEVIHTAAKKKDGETP